MEKNILIPLFKWGVGILIFVGSNSFGESDDGVSGSSYEKELEELSKAIEKMKSNGAKEISSEKEDPRDSYSTKQVSKKNDFSKSREEEVQLAGQPKIIRNMGKLEVFFKDLSDSYFIPSGNKQYEINKIFEQAIKKGTIVSFKAGKKSRQIIEASSSLSSSGESK